MRFIDLALHGGCSKKGPAIEVRSLLQKVQEAHAGSRLELVSKNFPDCGVYSNGETLLSTVDIVLPMTLSPIDFGTITVSHVLSDIYASGGLPIFALCILGIPGGMQADSKLAVEVMSAASEQLLREGARLVGGHTMTEQQDFYLGFSVIGRPIAKAPFVQASARLGDVLILTKPLGTSIATARWKLHHASEADHCDVLEGMRKSNRDAAIFLANCDVHACTDITGYGFLGHLFNILNASGVAARINASQVPCYESLRHIASPDRSGQFWHNDEYIRPHLTVSTKMTELLATLLFDSQVSGGLVVSAPRSDVTMILDGLRRAGDTATVIGGICEGEAGAIELVS